MGPKYEFTGEMMEFRGHILQRIRRLSDNTLGGWLEYEDNLSQYDSCWVGGEAKVFEAAEVADRAQVYDNAIVSGEARIYGNAKVYENAQIVGDGWTIIHGNAEIFGRAWLEHGYTNSDKYDLVVGCEIDVSGNAKIYGHAHIVDCCIVRGEAEIFDNAWIGVKEGNNEIIIKDKAKIYGNAQVFDAAEIRDQAEVFGNSQVYDNAIIAGSAKIYEKAKIHNGAYEEGTVRGQAECTNDDLTQDDEWIR